MDILGPVTYTGFNLPTPLPTQNNTTVCVYPSGQLAYTGGPGRERPDLAHPALQSTAALALLRQFNRLPLETLPKMPDYVNSPD